MHCRVSLRWISVRAAGVIVMAALVMAAAPVAGALATGSISGTVKDTDGDPLAGVNVYVHAGSDPALIPANSQSGDTVTDAAGHYTLSGVPAGSARVCFYTVRIVTLPFVIGPGRANGPYLSQCFSNASTLAAATPVAVSDGVTTPDIDATMRLGGKITGTALTSRGTPLKGPIVATDGHGHSDSDFPIDGHYSLQGLDAGTYVVGSGPDDAYYNGKTTQGAADPVAVTEGQTTAGIDVRKSVGTISGTVTDTAGHLVENAAVGASPVGGDLNAYETGTDGRGRYTLEVASGVYGVGTIPGYEFFRQGGALIQPGYLAGFFDGKTSRAAADPVTVTENATTSGVDVRLVLPPQPPPPAPSNAFTIASRTLKRDGLVIGVAVPGAGVVRAAGTVTYRGHTRYRGRKLGFTAARAISTKAARTHLTLKPYTSTKRLLATGKAVRAKVRVTFTPEGGTPATRSTIVTVRRR